MAAVELESPRGHFRFGRVPPEDTAGAEGPVQVKGGWRSEVPDVDYEVNQQLLDRLAVALGNLRADDVADGSNVGAYGLGDSVHRAVLTVRTGGEATRQVRMQFGNEVPGAEMDGARYGVVEGDETVYVIPGWSFRQLFPKGQDAAESAGPESGKGRHAADRLVLRRRHGQACRASPRHPMPRGKGEGEDATAAWQMDEPLLGFPGQTGWGGRLGRVSGDIRARWHGAGKRRRRSRADSLPRVEITMQDDSRHLIRLAGASGAAADRSCTWPARTSRS